jgi:hypothetical protein
MSAKAAIGISVHTGWGACVLVSGSPARPKIFANEVIRVLADDERFCFHMAAEMKPAEAARWIARMRRKALANARKSLAPFEKHARVCAIVAKAGDAGPLEDSLASHPRIHTAEGCFYRDVLCEASSIPVRVIAPSALDISGIGKISPPPWGRDQKLAAAAAWQSLA